MSTAEAREHAFVSNEGKCCDAVLQVLERRLDGRRQHVIFDSPSAPAVDIQCEINGRRFALEHTLLEPYEAKVKGDQFVTEVLDGVVEQVRKEGGIPRTGFYSLGVAAGHEMILRSKDFASVKAKVLSWVRQNLSSVSFSGSPAIVKRAADSDFPLELLLVRNIEVCVGVLVACRFVQEDLGRKWSDRVARALKDKLPKLNACRITGAYSILVLENQDGALSSVPGTAEIVNDCLMHTGMIPDEVFLVDCVTEGTWWVWVLRRGSLAWADLARIGVECIEFAPLDLDNITRGKGHRV